jgi:dihydropteroate synthase
MAIINVTPDSFSGDGLAASVDAAVNHALRMAGEGADVLDIGGESTRPGALPVGAAEEQDRILPVIEAIVARTQTLISVDTYRAETARLALAAGAHIVNDVWGLTREPEIAQVAARAGAGVVIMHTGRERDKLPDLIEDQFAFFSRSLLIASTAGLADDQVMLDPGFGFAKETPAENISLMARFPELLTLGFPLLAGTSRKRFVGAISGRDASDRDAATAATSVFLRLAGADVFRVHSVAINKDALAVADAMLEQLADRGRNR